MNEDPSVGSDRETSLNEFFGMYEHLFVITGVFGGFAVYLANLKGTIEVSNEGIFSLGIFFSFLLSILTGTLIGYYVIISFSRYGSLKDHPRIRKFGKYSYLAVFGMCFYFLIAIVFMIISSLTGPVLYFAGVSSLVILGIVVLIPILGLLQFRADSYTDRRISIYVTIYFFGIGILFSLIGGYLGVRYGADPWRISELEPFSSFGLNVLGVISFASVYIVAISYLLTIIFGLVAIYLILK